MRLGLDMSGVAFVIDLTLEKINRWDESRGCLLSGSCLSLNDQGFCSSLQGVITFSFEVGA